MADPLDLLVLGTGTAGTTVATTCREEGWRVGIVDELPYGGTCALRGCDPKKVLVAGEEAVDWARRMQPHGFQVDKPRLDWQSLMKYKRTFTDPFPERRAETFRDKGIKTYHGHARFTGSREVKVGGERLTARHIVIATGATPVRLDVPGEEHLTTSAEFLDLDTLPERVAFVGGGYISMEFAHLCAHAGVREVTILHRSERPLKNFDPDLVDILVKRTRALGITLHLETSVEALEPAGDGLRVKAKRKNGDAVAVGADIVVHGAGRTGAVEGLDLDAAGVERVKKGVKVNRYLQSASNPAVYAAGDAAVRGGAPLTPVASHEGEVVAMNLLKGNHREPDYAGLPSVAFTSPPITSAGLQEREAMEGGRRVRVNHEETSAWFSSRRIGEEASGFKVILDEETGKILGAHLLGHHSEEVINVFALAIRHGLTAEQLKAFPFAYPTRTSDIAYMV